jgi:hypothetical protein
VGAARACQPRLSDELPRTPLRGRAGQHRLAPRDDRRPEPQRWPGQLAGVCMRGSSLEHLTHEPTSAAKAVLLQVYANTPARRMLEDQRGAALEPIRATPCRPAGRLPAAKWRHSSGCSATTTAVPGFPRRRASRGVVSRRTPKERGGRPRRDAAGDAVRSSVARICTPLRIAHGRSYKHEAVQHGRHDILQPVQGPAARAGLTDQDASQIDVRAGNSSP